MSHWGQYVRLGNARGPRHLAFLWRLNSMARKRRAQQSRKLGTYFFEQLAYGKYYAYLARIAPIKLGKYRP